MLVVSDKRLVPVQINTTVLQGDDGAYYYLHRDLYDQLTIIWDKYERGDLIHLVAAQIKDGMAGVDTWPDNVQTFYNLAPSPLKAAAPFLFLVTGVEQLTSMEDMCGALTVVSMSINLKQFLRVDKSIRAAVTFSLHVREEYRTYWDRFFQENPEFGEAVTLPPPRPTVQQVPTPDGGMIVVDEESGEEEVVQVTAPLTIDWDAMMAEMTADLAPAKPAAGNDDGGSGDDHSAAAATAGGGSGFDLMDDL